jgi:hypothetical protein
MELLKRTTVALAAVATLGTGVARADLVFVSPVTIGGTGLGAVNTILTIQSVPGQATTEAGCVAFVAPGVDQIGTSRTGGVCTGTGSDVKTGSSQTQTRTLSEAGITTAANFALFFNANQQSDGPITLNSVAVSFYNNAGVLLHPAMFTGPITFNPTFPGIGKSGFMFQLNAAEAAIVQGFINTNTAAGIHVGVDAVASLTDDGPETFFIFNSTQAVPEPSTVALMATGLIGLVGFARRRRA